MTASSHTKAFKQLRSREAKMNKFIKHNAPKERSCGRNLRKCIRCGRAGSHIRKYGLGLCRQCFREVAPSIGFKKFS